MCAQNYQPDHELLQQMQKLQSQIQELRQSVEDQRRQQDERPGINFLLAEYDRVAEFWRHTDSRLESGINIYLTLSAIAVSALVLLSQQSVNVGLLFGIAMLAALALLVTGVMLADRMIGTIALKVQYLNSINLVRRFFAENYSEIVPYLSLPLTYVHSPRLLSHRPLIAILIWDSLLLGFVISAGIWLGVRTISIIAIAACGFVVAVLCLVLLTVGASQRLRHLQHSRDAKPECIR